MTYAQRIARNYYENVVPLPRDLRLAPSYAKGAGRPDLTTGLKSLHDLLLKTYLLASTSPETYHLPLSPDAEPRTGKEYYGATRSVARLPRVFFAIGILGRVTGEGGAARLVVPFGDLEAYCRTAGVARLGQLLSDLEAVGMVHAQVGQSLEVSFPGASATALGLGVFAKAARAFTRDLRHPPDVFCRADLRILGTADARARAPEVTIDDAARPLDHEPANVLRALAAQVEALGYRPELKCSGLARGEWRGSYTNPKLGRTLFGFVVEENRLAVRFVFETTPQIAPAVANLPERLREAMLRFGACRKCGRCKTGPVVASLAGQDRHLCRSFWLVLSDVTAAEIEPLQRLATVQDQILRGRAAGGPPSHEGREPP